MAISILATALMPLSQCIAWYMVAFDTPRTTRTPPTYTTLLESSSSPPSARLIHFYQVVCGIASFYCLWALYNRYLGGAVQELGHFSMGSVAVATYFQHLIASMMASTLVILNFLLPSYFILWHWNAATLAETVKGNTSTLGIAWAYVFKMYFVSQILLWSTILYKFLRHRHDHPSVPIGLWRWIIWECITTYSTAAGFDQTLFCCCIYTCHTFDCPLPPLLEARCGTAFLTVHSVFKRSSIVCFIDFVGSDAPNPGKWPDQTALGSSAEFARFCFIRFTVMCKYLSA